MQSAPKSSVEDAPVMNALKGINDLTNEIRRFGVFFIVFSFVFYISVPLLYYYAGVHWSLVDSIFFCVVTWATVGYGDILPLSASQRSFTSIWILIGLCVTGNLIGVISAVVNERHKREMFKLQKARMHKDEEEIIRIEKWLKARSLADLAPPVIQEGVHKFRKLFDKLTLYEEFMRRVHENDLIHNHQNNKIAKLRVVFLQDLQDMRYQVFMNFVWLMVALCIGAYVMVYLENWDVNEGFFWAVVTLATVGYGDYVPTNNSSKIFTCFFIIIGGIILVTAVTSLIWTPIKMLELKNEIKVIRQFEYNMTGEKFRGVVEHPLFFKIKNLKRNEKEISKAEFVLTILNLMNKVKDSDIDIASDIFDTIDVHREGVLSDETKQRYLREMQTRSERESGESSGGGDGVDGVANTNSSRDWNGNDNRRGNSSCYGNDAIDDDGGVINGDESNFRHDFLLEKRLTENPILHAIRGTLNDIHPSFGSRTFSMSSRGKSMTSANAGNSVSGSRVVSPTSSRHQMTEADYYNNQNFNLFGGVTGGDVGTSSTSNAATVTGTSTTSTTQQSLRTPLLDPFGSSSSQRQQNPSLTSPKDEV